MEIIDFEILKDWLDEAYLRLNNTGFIEQDPISIPHLFTKKEDIEIAGFLTATIAWGQRQTILKNAHALMLKMDFAPYQFVLNASDTELKKLQGFVHRTFNGTDVYFFILSLRNIYLQHGGIENVFRQAILETDMDVTNGLKAFRLVFIGADGFPNRTQKHISDVAQNSSAKRLNMYLRWMVRKDKGGVDFGIWDAVKPYQLLCPLDLHTGRVARSLGLLNRKQDDFRAVLELTSNLKHFDVYDPVKYDIALFGLGVEGFLKKNI